MIRNNIKLSNRLMMSARMVTKGYSVADVGCDHAHTCIYLIKEKISPWAVAMDVRKGPLSHAEENIRQYGYEDRIVTRLSNGLEALETGETDSVIIAGMGGTLTIQILESGMEKAKKSKELILQPQSDIGSVRSFLRNNGFKIIAEDMCRELGKYYTSIKAIPDNSEKDNENLMASEDQAVFDEFGEFLIKQNNPVLTEYLEIMKTKTERVLQRICSEGSSESLEKKEYFKHYLGMVLKASDMVK